MGTSASIIIYDSKEKTSYNIELGRDGYPTGALNYLYKAIKNTKKKIGSELARTFVGQKENWESSNYLGSAHFGSKKTTDPTIQELKTHFENLSDDDDDQFGGWLYVVDVRKKTVTVKGFQDWYTYEQYAANPTYADRNELAMKNRRINNLKKLGYVVERNA